MDNNILPPQDHYNYNDNWNQKKDNFYDNSFQTRVTDFGLQRKKNDDYFNQREQELNFMDRNNFKKSSLLDRPLFGYTNEETRDDIHFHGNKYKDDTYITHAHFKDKGSNEGYGDIYGYDAVLFEQNLKNNGYEKFDMIREPLPPIHKPYKPYNNDDDDFQTPLQRMSQKKLTSFYNNDEYYNNAPPLPKPFYGRNRNEDDY